MTYLELQNSLVHSTTSNEPTEVVELTLTRLEVGCRGLVLHEPLTRPSVPLLGKKIALRGFREEQRRTQDDTRDARVATGAILSRTIRSYSEVPSAGVSSAVALGAFLGLSETGIKLRRAAKEAARLGAAEGACPAILVACSIGRRLRSDMMPIYKVVVRTEEVYDFNPLGEKGMIFSLIRFEQRSCLEMITKQRVY